MSLKTTKIVFWITTGIIFLFEGVMPGLTGLSDLAYEGITSLGYPRYFVPILTVAKVLGALTIIIPKMPARLKEWAYAGFTFNLLCAFISHWVVKGMDGQTIFPLIILAILMASYFTYHKLKSSSN